MPDLRGVEPLDFNDRGLLGEFEYQPGVRVVGLSVRFVATVVVFDPPDARLNVRFPWPCVDDLECFRNSATPPVGIFERQRHGILAMGLQGKSLLTSIRHVPLVRRP